jgi:hypothetical protein
MGALVAGPGKDQVRKIAISATIKMTLPLPYFTSLMKPS